MSPDPRARRAWCASRAAGLARASGPGRRHRVTGANGTARAYAHVIAGTSHGATPTLDASATKGFTSVAYGTAGQGGGEFCLLAPGINPSDSAPVVSTYYDAAFANTQATAFPDAGAPNCPSGDFEVIEQAGGSAATGVDFDIVVP